MKQAVLTKLLTARQDKKPVALITLVDSGRQSLIYTDTAAPNDGISKETLLAARKALRKGQSGLVETMDGTAFVQVFAPPRRLLIVGAVHIAQALAPMAGLAGYEVTVIDPRRAFATNERFPFVHVMKEWPDRALQRLAPDDRTAIVLLTHDPKLDEPALKMALQSDAFYVAALGSKKTQEQRRQRLSKGGLDEQALSRIHGPAGLDLGARTPGEIAISIMAELTQVLREDSKV
ncbi:MAG: XdhC family protein [Acidiferrobacterales bacterium]